jgi:hypothetical protein
MKNLLIGLIIGLLLVGLGVYLVLPLVKRSAYQGGYDDGATKGVSTGVAVGKAKCAEEIMSVRKHTQDSLVFVGQQIEAQKKAKELIWVRRQKKVNYNQNWHVIDGQIGDPIPD